MDYILSREILMILFFVHCWLIMFGSTVKFYVPIKAYKSFFVLEVSAVSGYIVYTCVTEPFYNGVFVAILGYLMIYFIIWATYISLRHWVINPNKEYEFKPENRVEWATGEKALDGYITESGERFHVYIDDEKIYHDVDKEDVYLVRFREWKKFAPRVDVVEKHK